MPLDRCRKRQQCDVARLLDRFRQTTLMRRAHPGDTPGSNLASIADEGSQHAGVLIIDVVDLLDAEPAHLLAPEILLLACDRFVAAGGPLGGAPGSSTAATLFCHDGSPLCSPALFFHRRR